MTSKLSPFFSRSLTNRAGRINLCGPGKSPGSAVYLDLRDGSTVEVYIAQVSAVGPVFALAQVAGNQALGLIQFNPRTFIEPIKVGDVLLAGDIQFRGDTPIAQRLWRAHPLEQPNGDHPLSPRRPVVANGQMATFGRVVEVADVGTWGFIAWQGSTMKVFVHISNLRDGARLMVGEHVRFDLIHNDRGPTALNVRPA